MSLYSAGDRKRIYDGTPSTHIAEPFRTEFWKDYARLVHSPAFRRLQGKTQLFPSHENDYFRNRLTHSIEVAQIAKTIALKLNHEQSLDIDPDLIEFAALAHDIGHPPFGHQGEEALDDCMVNYGGFEGNAQTLRILTRLEKKHSPTTIFDVNGKDLRVGLDLTSRTIASILKYDNVIPVTRSARLAYAKEIGDELIHPVKGYYASEKDIVDYVKENVLNGYSLKNSDDEIEKFKTIECKIMDISDDIAYSTYDLDDTLKANFHNPLDIVFARKEIVERISKKTSKIFKRTVSTDEVKKILFGIFSEVFNVLPPELKKEVNATNFDEIMRIALDVSYRAANNLAKDGYLRNAFTSRLIHKFISGVQYEPHAYLPLSTVKIRDDVKIEVEVLKTFNYEVNILSSRLKIPAYRGKQIVKEIFDILIDDSLPGYMLMPDDFKETYLQCNTSMDKHRAVCDFIAGMTDKYCVEFYARLTSENPETFFKPI